MSGGMTVLLSIGGLCAVLFVLAAIPTGNQTPAGQTTTVRTTSAPAPPICSASDFSVDKLNAGIEYGYAKLTGIVRNGCDVSAGVELKWTAYNSDGSVAFSHTFFPASTVNIAPKTNYPFETSNSAPQDRKGHYTVEPVRIIRW